MTISVIMPTLDEATNVPSRARELARQPGPWEWIVSDGGSTDATVALARAAGATIVAGARGRGAQLDAGAARATGEILLFLHADTSLPSDAFASLRRAMRDERFVGGNFTLRFDGPGIVSRAFAACYALQRRLLHAYFGDSAIFVRRATFDRIGGYGDLPIMEDDVFVRKLERAGRTVLLRAIVTTSARRYRDRPARSVVLWASLMLLHRLGVPAKRLRPFYAPHRDR